MNRMQAACEWITRLAWINVLWLTFTFVGLLVFGFGPSTAAMFTVVRKWIQGERDVPIARIYWRAFRREFWAANRLTWLLLVFGSVLFIDERFLTVSHTAMTPYLRMGTLLPIVAYVVTVLFIFPVLVHFDLSMIGYVKYSFLIAITHPLETLWMLVATVVVYAGTLAFPGLFLFFGGSVLSFVSTWLAHRAFEKIASRTAASRAEPIGGESWTISDE